MSESTPIPRIRFFGREMSLRGADDGEQGRDGGEVDVAGLGDGEDRFAGEAAGDEEQDRKEGVAAEDVADG